MKFEEKQKALYELALYDAEFNRKLAELKEAEEKERREHVVEIWMDKNGIYSLIEEEDPCPPPQKQKLKGEKRKWFQAENLSFPITFKSGASELMNSSLLEEDLKPMWSALEKQIEKEEFTLDKIINLKNNKSIY